ncbi:hypothetical protein OG361_33550 [Streptomyces sp. NBC_00090]|uniref:hypothetical protein n=1 Tax=Streptomyces sp. NBC_00090 TaxID=2903619 RepID=UPI00324D91A7
MPPPPRAKRPDTSAATLAGLPANLKAARWATSTSAHRARTKGAESGVAGTWSFQPWARPTASPGTT